MTKEQIIEKALTEDIELSREEYAEKKRRADEITTAHGVDGEAPLSEDERERRMRMNYYGSVLNILMTLLAAVDDLSDRITTLNNNLVMLGGAADERDENSGASDSTQ